MSQLISFLKNNQITLAWLFLSNIAAAFNYLFQFLNRFHLPDSDFADLGSLANIQLVFTSLLLIPFVATATEFMKTKKEERLNELFTATFIISLFSGLLIIISSFFSQEVFNISDQWSVFMVGLSIIFLGIPVVLMGILMGLEKFVSVGFLRIVEPSVKVLTATLALIFNFSLFYIFAGALVASVAALAGFLFVLYKIKKLPRLDFKGSFKTLSQSFYNARFQIFYLFGITLFYTADVILVNIFAPKDIAGRYATLSLIGKIIFFGAMPVTQVFYNRFLEKTSLRNLIRSNLYIITLVLIPFLPLIIFPETVNIIFQADVSISSEEIRVFVTGATLLTISYLNGHFLVACKNILGFLFIPASFFVFLGWIVVKNNSLLDLSIGYSISSTLLLGGLVFMSAYCARKNIKYS